MQEGQSQSHARWYGKYHKSFCPTVRTPRLVWITTDGVSAYLASDAARA
jgi:hypothetical protein